jgi:hypothetical protein
MVLRPRCCTLVKHHGSTTTYGALDGEGPACGNTGTLHVRAPFIHNGKACAFPLC